MSRGDARLLGKRLARAGVESGADPLTAWRRLREVEGPRATLIDLYRMVAGPRGLNPHELALTERMQLARAIMPSVWPGFELTQGSERRGDPIELDEYDPAWPARYRAWRRRLAKALIGIARRIEHVGSTAVPGLAAKPVIDIQVTVDDIEVERSYVPRLEAIGLQLRSRDELHRYFRPFLDRPRDVHVHVCDSGSSWERDHLLFRDYLRTHAGECERYAKAKRAAAAMWPDDRWAYTDAKGEAVLDIFALAEHWAAVTGWKP